MVTSTFQDHMLTTASLSEPAPPDSSPASQKKGGVSGSVMDRLRSPGTVRKLSLKMKKLPELRRKLSLRSSSRASRQGNDARGGGDESTSKNAASSSSSSSALSNQNVISRYHLDSSTPPARPLRRSSRGRSASKGGSRPVHVTLQFVFCYIATIKVGKINSKTC